MKRSYKFLIVGGVMLIMGFFGSFIATIFVIDDALAKDHKDNTCVGSDFLTEHCLRENYRIQSIMIGFLIIIGFTGIAVMIYCVIIFIRDRKRTRNTSDSQR